jgi:transposase
MFIRKTTHRDNKNKKTYHTFKLIESLRTDRGPRQRTLLNLGTDFSLPQTQWKDLANRIEELVTGQENLFAYPQEIETLAIRYARRVIDSHSHPLETTQTCGHPDYQRVNIDTVDHERVRSIGAEQVVYETIQSLGLDELMRTLGFNKPALEVAIGVIAARLIAPSSERAAHQWLQDTSGLDELLGTDFSNLSQDRVYKASDMLLRCKKEIEAHLRSRESTLFSLQEKIILYDLTNTFFEGSGKYNSKAHFGPSQEKRSDCPLVTLGMVLDADGFPKRTEVFAGNVSEPGTLERMIASLSLADRQTRPLIVMDAGIAVESNLLWLKEHDYDYLAVSRKKKMEVPPETQMVTLREDNRRLIRGAILVNRPDSREITLYCHSTDKDIKERGIKNRFESRFEEELGKVDQALARKHGIKRYDKVLEKIGRLKERFKRVAHRYEITVTQDETTNLTTAVSWERKDEDNHIGVYCLRSNRMDFKEQEMFNLFAMLTDIEDAFRSMKSELGLRPVYHQKEHRADGHLFITVLAYHVLHTICVLLRKQGIHDSWSTIRRGLSSHVRITTTMKRDDNKIIHIRKSTRPEPFHKRIYDALRLPHRPGKTIKAIL